MHLYYYCLFSIIYIFINSTAVSITTDGNLHAHIQGAVFMSNTQEHQLILTCGTFNHVWHSRVDVTWTVG